MDKMHCFEEIRLYVVLTEIKNYLYSSKKIWRGKVNGLCVVVRTVLYYCRKSESNEFAIKRTILSKVQWCSKVKGYGLGSGAR